MVEDIGPVAVGMGGESTGPRASFKANPPNSYEAQVELEVCRAWWTVVWPVCRGFRSRNAESHRQFKRRRAMSNDDGPAENARAHCQSRV